MIKTKFWIFCALVLLVIGANFYYTTQRVDAGILSNAESRLTWGEARVGAVENTSAEAALEAAVAAAAKEQVRAALEAAADAESAPDRAAFQGVVEALAEGVAATGAPPHGKVLLATEHGASIFHVEREIDVRSPPPPVPALNAALGGEPRVALWMDDGELMRVAAAPVAGEEGLAGAILLGYPIDDDHARRASEAVGADVSIVVEGSVIASTAPQGWRLVLSSEARRAALGRTFGFGDASGSMFSVATSLTGVEPVLGFGRTVPLGEVEDAFLVLSVRVDEDYAWLDEYQVYQVAAFGLMVLVGLIWAFFISVSAKGPVARMVSQLSRAASGDMKTRLEVPRFKGQMRRLAEIINSVLDQTERKAPATPAALGAKQPDISSLLTDAPPEPEEPSPDAFDFGFGEDRAEPAPEEPAAPEGDDPPLPAASEQEPEPPPPAPEEPPAPPAEAGAGEAPSGPRIEADQEEDPFAAFASEPESPPAEAPEAREEAAEADPFAAFDSPPPAPADPGDLAAAEMATAGDYHEDDSTRVVSMGDMAAAAKAAEIESSAPPSPPGAGPAAAAAPSEEPASAQDPFASAMSAPGEGEQEEDDSPDATVVAKVPEALLQATARAAAGGGALAPDPDEAHFREVFRSFVATRQKCGESADGLTFEKFAVKLRKNRDTIREKYAARTVRFQVYVKEGKAALKATPVK